MIDLRILDVTQEKKMCTTYETGYINIIRVEYLSIYYIIILVTKYR